MHVYIFTYVLPASYPRRAYGGSSDGDQPPQQLPYFAGAHYRDKNVIIFQESRTRKKVLDWTATPPSTTLHGSSDRDQPPQQLPYLAGAHYRDNNVIILYCPPLTLGRHMGGPLTETNRPSYSPT